jgi:predicted site-specific integrase-resolvase
MSTVVQILTMQKACKRFGIRADTLRRWADNGDVPSFRSPNRVRMFHLNDLEKFFNINRVTDSKEKIVYARVSSYKQRDDLERQIDLLKQKYPDHTVVQDIGSGINFKRKGLQTLLERCMRREIQEIVVAHKDRLCRFGFDLIKQVVETTGGRIIVLDEEVHKSTEQELAEDLLSIIHVFNCRQMGKRRYTEKPKNKNLPDSGTEEDD